MATTASLGLAWMGLSFGIALTLAAAPWREFSQARLNACAALLVAANAIGAVVLIGTVSHIYRPCPICIGVWSAVEVATLALIARGQREGRALVFAVAAFTLAGAWTRFDGTTSMAVANLLPHTNLASDCVADVLTDADLMNLRDLGMPQGVPVIFVTRCSPCAASTLGRFAQKHPAVKIVAADSTLAPIVRAGRLIVFPALDIRAAKLQGNLYELTIKGGGVIQCNSNVTGID